MKNEVEHVKFIDGQMDTYLEKWDSMVKDWVKNGKQLDSEGLVPEYVAGARMYSLIVRKLVKVNKLDMARDIIREWLETDILKKALPEEAGEIELRRTIYES